MGSVFMPVDRCTRENSCLQVLKTNHNTKQPNILNFVELWKSLDFQVLAGSHQLGRVDHFLMGDQSGADPDKVEMAKKFGCKHLHVEMQPGDALFFHANLLHTR